MPEHTITGLGKQREFNSQYGAMIDYTVDCGDEKGLSLTQKKDSPPPTVGQTISGDIIEETITPKSGGEPFKKRKLKKTPQGNFGGGGGGGGGKGMTPEREAAIVRQHSQEMSLRFFAITGFPEGQSALECIKTQTDWFYDDATGGEKPVPAFKGDDGSLPHVTPPEAKQRIAAAWKESGADAATVKAYLSEQGIESTDKMNPEQVDALVAWLGQTPDSDSPPF